jgi:hypothetical protein
MQFGVRFRAFLLIFDEDRSPFLVPPSAMSGSSGRTRHTIASMWHACEVLHADSSNQDQD